jgi:hypothetical protein
MSDVIRIKRRSSGGGGAPSSLAASELAYNEVDDSLWYGKGNSGGNATSIQMVGGTGMASSATPLMDGTAAVGTATTWARGDHVHPTDTSRAPLASPVFTGNPTAPTPSTGDNDTSIATTAHVKAQSLNNFQPPISSVDWNNVNIINLRDPTNAQDAATKKYVDNVATGLDAKPTAVCATTTVLPNAPSYSNGTAGVGATLTASSQGVLTIDGVSPALNDYVLVKNQAAPERNGLYTLTQYGDATHVYILTRDVSMDQPGEIPGALVVIAGGTNNANTLWICNPTVPVTIGTTALPFTQLNAATSVIAGGGLTMTGNTLDVVGTANRISIAADSIDIDSAYVGQTSITTVGTITTGAWSGSTISVNRGGTGVTTFAAGSYLKGNGLGNILTSATIPNTDVTGLGTMSTQNANAVAITGGTIDNVVFDGGTF